MIKNVGPIRFDSNGTADLGPTICTQKADRFKSAPHLPKTYLSAGFLESMSGVLKLLKFPSQVAGFGRQMDAAAFSWTPLWRARPRFLGGDSMP